jgi:arylsulfatase A-like enzyme
MDRRRFLQVLGAGAAGVLIPRPWLSGQPAPAGAGRSDKPNIVIIVADDLGYAGLGVQGCKDIPTPSIDSIAKAGVRFTNGYVTCPVCSPTRAGIITGRYQQRFGHEFNPGPNPNDNFGLPLTEVTLADVLKAAGYATGIVGKWHLGNREKYRPLQRGFQEFFGFLHGAHSYLKLAPNDWLSIFRNNEPVAEKEYLTDAFTREAVAFIDRRKAEPFFLYLTYNAVHAPMEAVQKYMDRFPDIKNDLRRKHAAMMAAMDDGVGQVLDKLRKEKLLDNTLLFFISDNGGPTRQTTSSNEPLRGFKGQVLEGGIRIPYMVQWPGRVPVGKTYDQPVVSLDMFATAVAAAGAKAPEGRALDGVDLLPCLSGRNDKPPHEALHWRFGRQHAIRRGNWKLLKTPQGASEELYNLADDIAEARNLAAEKPEMAKELSEAWSKWNSQMIDPLWGGAGAASRPASRPGRARGTLTG